MLRAMFGRKSRSSQQNERKKPTTGKEATSRSKKKAEQEVEENYRANAMARTEVREAKFNFPASRMTMTDRLESHSKGNLFKYAVISTEPPKNRSFIMDRLRTYKPPNDHVNFRLDDLPPLLLNDEYTEVDLWQAIPNKKVATQKPFCMIADVFIHYVPMDTFMSTQSTVEVMLTDGRKLEESVVRHASISSNLGYNVLFTLDYCVETKDMHDMKLSISRHVSQFKKGKTWAMCKVLIGLDFYDIAKRSNIQESLAVAQFAETDLMEFLTDPRGADSVVTGEALRQMRLAYQTGDIENLTVPSGSEKKMSTAATIVGTPESVGAMEAGEVISSMKQLALLKQREMNAQPSIKQQNATAEPQKLPMKSALKRPSTPTQKVTAVSPPESNATEEIERGNFNNLSEVEMGESVASSSSSAAHEELFEQNPPFVSKLRFNI
jgi:hypothetical protein